MVLFYVLDNIYSTYIANISLMQPADCNTCNKLSIYHLDLDLWNDPIQNSKANF